MVMLVGARVMAVVSDEKSTIGGGFCSQIFLSGLFIFLVTMSVVSEPGHIIHHHCLAFIIFTQYPIVIFAVSWHSFVRDVGQSAILVSVSVFCLFALAPFLLCLRSSSLPSVACDTSLSDYTGHTQPLGRTGGPATPLAVE